MDRATLKQTLDEIAAESGVLARTCSLLSSGPKRSLSIDADGITLVLHESNCAFHWVPEDPRTAVASLVALGTYEPVELEILSSLATTSSVTLDIGANVGFYAVFLGRVVETHGTLHCFEPLPTAFEQLNKNISLNNLHEHVFAHNLALSDSTGIETLHIPQISGTSATSMRNLHPDEVTIAHEVRTETLDSWVSRNGVEQVDLVKIDVEGAERLVLRGGWSMISTHKPVIFAELLRKWSAGFGYHPQQVVKELKDLGYRCYAVGPKLRQIDEIDDDTVETNFLFLTDSEPHSEKFDGLRSIGLVS
jgi:FkbM family methyltransferase